MTERQQLIAQKLQILSMKQTLEKLSGIEIMGIVDDNDNSILNEIYLAYEPIMCSYTTVPYSKISYKSSEEQVISWIAVSMELKENICYFFYCHNTWVKIRFLNLHDGIKSLWKHRVLGFVLVNNNLTQIMEASFDSRDEDNYLIDVWNYERQKRIDENKNSRLSRNCRE